jgi:ABC-type Fe3+/spermidine/putrescine transport system ATPase subunit
MSLEIVKLSKRHGNDWVLRDLDLTAREGRILGICGGTGSGKSTLLNMLVGQSKPDGGSILLDGNEVTKTSVKERGASLFTGRDTPGLLELLGFRSKSESSGEGQIRILDDGLANANRMVLLDDPFCHLDTHMRQECFGNVRRAARARDRIVIFASSDFSQIADLADDAAILASGTIIQTGTPLELYENPEMIDAARITGEDNLFEARRLTAADAEFPEFHTIDGGHRIFAQLAEKNRVGAINRNVMLAIRPEQISMSIGKSFPEENSLRAVVTSIKFRGETTMIDFDAAGLKLKACVFRIAGLHIGDECMLGLPPHRVRILRD